VGEDLGEPSFDTAAIALRMTLHDPHWRFPPQLLHASREKSGSYKQATEGSGEVTTRARTRPGAGQSSLPADSRAPARRLPHGALGRVRELEPAAGTAGSEMTPFTNEGAPRPTPALRSWPAGAAAILRLPRRRRGGSGSFACLARRRCGDSLTGGVVVIRLSLDADWTRSMSASELSHPCRGSETSCREGV
jgi:hypothetical protein